VAALAALAILAASTPGCRAAEEGPGAQARPAAGAVAVVELFTSEGCSSCPPADQVLGSLAEDARSRGLSVYCLAFHVDYWDRLGWKDPYGTKAASQRQSAYARTFRAGRVYTPQMIVNGADEFVGSDAARAKKSIQTALSRPAAATATLKTEAGPKPGQLGVRFEVNGAPPGAVLQVAFVEKELSSNVARGENAGRKLKHFNVVRAFQTVDLAKAAKGSVTLDVSRYGPGTVIAYVQDAKTQKVVGAAAVAVTPSTTGRKP
jgi:hypothetical protein